jgi:two-component system response regulator
MNDPRILIVEDNPDDESLTQRGLRKSSAEIEVARDGALALEALMAMNRLPDLVLLDLKLPKIDGSEVLRQLRSEARTSKLCVVVFTSSSEPADIARCYALGCNSYVIKPVTYEDYIEAVRNIAGYWLMLNASPARPR